MTTTSEHWPPGFAVGDLVTLLDIGDLIVVANDRELNICPREAANVAVTRALCIYRFGRTDTRHQGCALFLVEDGTVHVFVPKEATDPRITLLRHIPEYAEIDRQSLKEILARYHAGDLAAVGGSTFPLGRVVATPGALDALMATDDRPDDFLARHRRGDWGDVCEGDRLLNDEAVKDGSRILSVFHLQNRTTLWIITEADRSVTTLLLPSEY